MSMDKNIPVVQAVPVNDFSNQSQGQNMYYQPPGSYGQPTDQSGMYGQQQYMQTTGQPVGVYGQQQPSGLYTQQQPGQSTGQPLGVPGQQQPGRLQPVGPLGYQPQGMSPLLQTQQAHPVDPKVTAFCNKYEVKPGFNSIEAL